MARCWLLIALLAVGSAYASDPEVQRPISDTQFVCQHPHYQVRKISTSPLILYIKNFITQKEREHLKAISKDTFRHSAIAGGSGAALNTIRTSQSTYVTRDAVVRCIEDRALSFQGYDVSRTQLEPLQLVKYSGPAEYYKFHFDWFTDPRYSFTENGGNRLSSFFVYVYVSNDTTGGGTNFPLVDAPTNERWCAEKILDCDEPYENGVTFRPAEGNAVFWENLTPLGVGDRKTLHAGLPIMTGEKIGMNIWTRQAALSEEARGPDEYPEI